MPLFSLTRRPPTQVMPASCFRCHWTRHLLFYIFLQNNLVTRVSLCAKLFTADKGCLAGLRLLLVTSHKGRMQTFTECHWGVIENIFPIKDDTGHFFFFVTCLTICMSSLKKCPLSCIELFQQWAFVHLHTPSVSSLGFLTYALFSFCFLLF